jgi:regulator of chromosome condensation
MEATPTQVDPAAFPQGTIFTQLAATKSATFVLTSTGSVYGWGTFRVGLHA